MLIHFEIIVVQKFTRKILAFIAHWKSFYLYVTVIQHHVNVIRVHNTVNAYVLTETPANCNLISKICWWFLQHSASSSCWFAQASPSHCCLDWDAGVFPWNIAVWSDCISWLRQLRFSVSWQCNSKKHIWKFSWSCHQIKKILNRLFLKRFGTYYWSLSFWLWSWEGE